MEKKLSQKSTILLLGFIISLATILWPIPPTQAISSRMLTPTPERPFQLPFAEPSSPQTWLMGQPYGNTTGAYRQRFTTYGASGGIHFGIDLSAPCGTEIVAIADGIVYAIDGPYGSAPHNLMIDHPQWGYASMYGHLRDRPALQPGQAVKQGEVIALVGDSDNDCERRPHLHLEIRGLDHMTKYNPLTLIEAKWDNLMLYGEENRSFTHNLESVRQWQTLYDQPEVRTGGPIVNNFAATWPLDWRLSDETVPPTPTPVPLSPQPTAMPLPIPTISPSTSARQITFGNCCTDFFWNKDSSQIRFIDQPTTESSVGIWGVDITPSETLPLPHLISEQLGIYSPDESLMAYPDRNQGLVIIEQVSDKQRWEVDAEGSQVSFTPDGQHLLWTVYDDGEVSWRAKKGDVWLSQTDGTNAQMLTSISHGSPTTWLSETELLFSIRSEEENLTILSKFSLEDHRWTELIQLPRIRDVAFSPDKRYMIYLIRSSAQWDKNGLWLLDLQAESLEPQRLPFFGTYRWRDGTHIVYVPFNPEAEQHIFHEYNLISKQSRQLFPKMEMEEAEEVPQLIIANNEWRISPDGNKIALLAAQGTTLNGIWIIDLIDLEEDYPPSSPESEVDDSWYWGK